MLPTLGEVLALDAVRRGDPQVVAGADRLGARVRWVHVADVTDIAPLLKGGELVLTTGIALPDDPDRMRDYIAGLADVGVVGLVVELGRKYKTRLPPFFVKTAERYGLPLIELAQGTPFVHITESVHEQIIDVQMAELRASRQLHDTFTELSVEGASTARMLSEVARLAGRPVILENLTHQVLACEAAGHEPSALLASWETRSRGVRLPERTGYDLASGWLVAVIGARGEDWGRLIIPYDHPPGPRDIVLAERAATTLALGRLLERHEQSLERRAHGAIITGILAHDVYGDSGEVGARARAAGVPLAGHRLLGAVIRLRDAEGALPATDSEHRLTEIADAAAAACREAGFPALVGTLDTGGAGGRRVVSVGLLIPMPVRASEEDVLGALSAGLRTATAARSEPDFVLGAGSVVETVKDARRSLLEAEQVAGLAAAGPGDRPHYRLPDLRLRGLLHLLRDDARLQTFTERELGKVLEHDAQHGSDLTRILQVYLEAGRNKALAAQRAHLSRPAFYERLHRLERVLGTNLDDADSCLSLHVALLTLEVIRRDHR